MEEIKINSLKMRIYVSNVNRNSYSEFVSLTVQIYRKEKTYLCIIYEKNRVAND